MIEFEIQAQQLQAANEENRVLRSAVIAYMMREAHIAEMLQRVRRCPECLAYLTLSDTADRQPCEKYRGYSTSIKAAHQIFIDEAAR